jgi:hypothetical protein
MNEENRHEELQALKQDILSSLHCALPGTVVSFDAESQTAVIQPAVSRVIPSAVEGSPSSVSMPLLRDVPVFMPVSFEINPGDACLVIFADCDIDAWFENGEVEVPASNRMHSLSDGFAFVGFRPRVIPTASSVIPSVVEGSPSQGA